MKSLTIAEARRYCSQPALAGKLSVSKDNIPFYKESDLPPFFMRAPVVLRQAMNFVLTLVSATKGTSFEGGFIWFYQYHGGTLNSAHLGWKIIESIRRANGDPRTLDLAPAQHFRSNEAAELSIFLLQAVVFGWAGYFMPSGFNCLVNFRSSERWFFHSNEERTLTSLFTAMEEWNPAYEDLDAARRSAELFFEQAQQHMANGRLNEAIESYKSSLIADTDFLDAARGLLIALKHAGRDAEAEIIERELGAE